MRPKQYRVTFYMASGVAHVLDELLQESDVPRLSETRARTFTVWSGGWKLELAVAHIEAIAWEEVTP